MSLSKMDNRCEPVSNITFKIQLAFFISLLALQIVLQPLKSIGKYI